MANEKIIPRLCGGTFFTLLLTARKNTRESQNKFFKDLIQIYDPSVGVIHIDSFKTPVSQFKNCNQIYNCDYIKIGEQTTRRAFEDRFRTDYEGILKITEDLCSKYLTEGASSKSEIFVKDILSVIMLDDSIKPTDKLFIDFGGIPVRKEELPNITDLYFPSVLLGIFHFICTQRMDNSVGKETVNLWREKEFVSAEDAFPKMNLMFERPTSETKGKEVLAYASDEDDIIGDLSEIDPENLVIVRHSEHIKPRESKSIFEAYVARAYEAFKKSKSFFYPNEERDFYEFYVCNDLSKRSNSSYFTDSSSGYYGTPESYSDITINKLADLGRFAVIVGTGGLGKSMMMRHLMLDALKTYSEHKVLPAFVVLKDYDPKQMPLLSYIFSQVEHLNPDMVIDDFVALMRMGNVLFLLDGLDEIKAKFRDKFDDELNKLSERYNTCTFVLSSRPIGSFGEFKHFKTYNLEPLKKKQAIEVIKKLDFRVYDESIKNDFIKELDARLYREKRDFAGNPLLLTIMLITFEQFHKIPTQKFLFYEQAYEALTQKHDANKALTREYATGLDPYAFKQYFSEFCIITYHAEQYKFTREQLEQSFQLVIELNKLNTTPAAFIEDATDKICLLYLDGESYYFCHRSFQEYFAAYFCSRQIEDRFDPIREMFNDKDDNAFDDETLEMLFGMDEQKTEKQIIIPFLKGIFSSGDEYADYIEYLKRFYPKICFEKGETDDYSETQCESAQLLFITEYYKIKQEIVGDNLDCDYDMATEMFVYMDKNWNVPDSTPKMKVVNYDELPEGYRSRVDEYDYEDEDNIEYVGMRVEIDVSYIYGEQKYRSIYHKEKALIEEESFPLHVEFRYLHDLYIELEEKYRKKKNSNWITMFH